MASRFENVEGRDCVSREKRDRELGMERRITRRDFLNGVGVTIGASLAAPNTVLGEMLSRADAEYAPEKEAGYYPPAKTGCAGITMGRGKWRMRCAMGRNFRQAKKEKESFDLIVVGGGISGLAAAYFYRQQAGEKAKILVLDNHDDFGGHAKRNEFTSGGKRLIGYGGTQSIAGPNLYSAQAKQLFTELGIEVKRFEKYNDQQVLWAARIGAGGFFR